MTTTVSTRAHHRLIVGPEHEHVRTQTGMYRGHDLYYAGVRVAEVGGTDQTSWDAALDGADRTIEELGLRAD